MAPAQARAARVLALPLAVAAVALAGCGDWHPRYGCALGDRGPRAYDALAYHLSARFDWEASRLAAEEEITVGLCPGVRNPILLDAGVVVSRVHAGALELPWTLDPASETLSVDLSSQDRNHPVTFTVEYAAPASDALVPTTSTAGDPVRSRVVFTSSEPRAGHRWLVEKDDPADRAFFSVEVEVAPGEDAVANGERVSDAAVAGGRRIGYALDAPIPTYLMAFAAGGLDHAERTFHRAAGGDLPLALWYRRGLVIDPSGNLDAVEDAMATFEERLGPYPFGRYAVVLLPAPFGGGMENATVTFDVERSGQGSIRFALNAHELAHHWFGDWVTMSTYDDVWVKEGMATLLAAEADRAHRDLEGRGRLMAGDFAYRPQDAIVDPDLTGLQKYTSGPYGRAAALVTQIRGLIGEEAFWSSCRAFLAANALGSATGEDFVRAFAPHLPERTVGRMLASLPHRERPDLSVVAEGDALTLTVEDPGADLLAPLRVTVVDGAGQGTVHTLTPGVPVTLTVPAAGYLAPDEEEAHAELGTLFDVFDAFGDPANPYDFIRPIPPAAGSPAGAALASRSAAHQERALAYAGLPALAGADLAGFVASLDSPYARQAALELACYQAASDPEVAAALAALLDAPPLEQFDVFLGDCPLEVASAFEAEFVALAASAGGADLARLEYLLSFSYGPAGQAATEALVSGGPSLEIRDWASYRTSLLRAAGPARPGAAAAPRLREEAQLAEGKGLRAVAP